MRPSHLPLRLTTGAFILNAGLSNRALDEQSAADRQNLVANAVPQVKTLSPRMFGKAMSAGEMALGVALLSPFVSPVAAGAALTAFGAATLQAYRKTPGLTQDDGVRPTPDGVVIAKDVFLVGAGLALLLDGIIDGGKGAAKDVTKTTKRAAKKAKRAVTH